MKTLYERSGSYQPAFLIAIGLALLGIGAAFLFMLFDPHKPGSSDYNKFLCIFFTGFVLMQMWNLFNARCLDSSNGPFHKLGQNRNFLLVVSLIFILQFIIVQFVPGDLFRTVRLDWVTWILLIAVTSAVLLFGWLLRLVNRKNV